MLSFFIVLGAHAVPMGARLWLSWPFAAAGLLLLVTACGAPADDSVRSPAQTQVDVTTTVAAEDSASSTTTIPVEATVSTTLTTTGTRTTAAVGVAESTATTLPGTPFDHIYISAGSVLGVVGIAFDDTLSVHSLPGSDQPVIGTLPPLSRDVVASGRAQLLGPGKVYLEVTAGGITGWVHSRHVLFIAGPQDFTAMVLSAFGSTPRAPSMLELGRTVVDALGPPPDAPSRILVVVSAPTDGSIAEVTFDEFFGEEFGDDSIAGDRYRVVGRQVPEGDLPVTGLVSTIVYELVRVEWTGLCWRGAAPEGLCV